MHFCQEKLPVSEAHFSSLWGFIILHCNHFSKVNVEKKIKKKIGGGKQIVKLLLWPIADVTMISTKICSYDNQLL